MTAGIAKMTMKAVIRIAQTKTGIRFNVIPGARSFITVTTISTATARAESSVKVIICAHMSARLPGPYAGPANGT